MSNQNQNHFSFQPRFYTNEDILSAPASMREEMLNSNEFQFDKMLEEINVQIPGTKEFEARKKDQEDLNTWMQDMTKLFNSLR